MKLGKIISLKKKQNFKRTLLTFTFVLSLAILTISSLFSGTTMAQTQYETTGTIGNADTSYHWIYNVQANDIVVVSVNPAEFSYNSYKSVVFYPNLTQVGSSQLDYTQNGYGTHSYQFVADAPGNYLLKFWTEGNGFNYTVKSSHQVSSGIPLQATPYSVAGQINVASTNWYTIQNVDAHATVLISVNPAEFSYNSYKSVVLYPNLTQVVSIGLDYAKLDFGPHSYQFVADAPGNYLLKFWAEGNGFNYTTKSSNQISSGIISQVTPGPTAPASTVTPANINVIAGGSVTFEVPSGYSSSGAEFTYYFGDGNNITTSETKVTHVYEKPGNYFFTLDIEGALGEKSIETYTVTVTSPSENPLVKYTWPIVTSVIAGLTVASITALVRHRTKGKEGQLPPPPPPK